MTDVDVIIGIVLIVIGAILLVMEFVHPGVLLLIPATVLIVAGALFVFLPNELLASPWGPLIVVGAAAAAGLAEIPYYRYIAHPTHPFSTTVGGLVGREAVVTSTVVPNSLHGKVRIGSEIWSARSDREIPTGTKVRVVSGEGVSVAVEPIREGTKGP